MSEIKVNKVSPRSGTTTTLGTSGDDIAIPSGVNLINNGTINAGAITGSGSIDEILDWDTTAKTIDFNAVVKTGYFVDTTSGAITVTLPASPSAGDLLSLKDYANTANTNNIIINPNGNKIQGATSNFVISVNGTAANFIYIDATQGWALIDASNAADIAEQALFVTATGGTETTCGDYKVHTFTGPGSFTVTCAGNPLGSDTADYLVVAGGGSAGNNPGQGGTGGGGAGGYITSFPGGTAESLVLGAYAVTVGAGGSASSPCASGNLGSPSIFSSITSTGGGDGGTYSSRAGAPGGSGGGAGSIEAGPGTGGSGNTPPVSPSQGNPGGNAAPDAGNNSGAGGGGASGAGTNSGPNGGAGGAGSANSITGSPVSYSGGGGGGVRFNGTAGSGGTGGGGAGGSGCGVSGTAGTANTGGGGGGSGRGSANGGSGGSGIVIIRYKYQ